MNWQIVIGLEIHVQLLTQSKLFSTAPIDYCQNPNTQVREVDGGLPGALPTLNRAAVDCALRLGLALSANINQRSEFARKNYFYPDLPKGYQISQFEYPIISQGVLTITTDEGEKDIAITRAHLEEDAGKLIHDRFLQQSAVDLNRAGVPLLEIVSEPHLYNINQAVIYAQTMHQLVRWLNICDGNMQEGSFRIDANVSLHQPQKPLGTRCEIKNLNSFRFLEQALKYEYQRQKQVLENNQTITQETRLFDPNSGITRPMRDKEDAHDYRYFPDPDLPPLLIDAQWIDCIRQQMPKLPWQCRQQLIDDYGLSAYDAKVITADYAWFDYYQQVVECLVPTTPEIAKLAANWLCGDLAALLNEHKCPINQCPINQSAFADLMRQLLSQQISGKIAKAVLLKMWESGDNPASIIKKQGWQQISDEATLTKIAQEIIANYPQQVEQYQQGKDRLLGFFVGKVMAQTAGQANPEQTHTLIKNLLAQE